MKRWLVRAVWAAVLIFLTLVIGGAVDARRRLPDLEAWHRYVPPDATASTLERATLADYLRREDTVFRDVRDRIERTSPGSAVPPANRYDRRSRSHPTRLGWYGNRTFELVPDGETAFEKNKALHEIALAGIEPIIAAARAAGITVHAPELEQEALAAADESEQRPEGPHRG